MHTVHILQWYTLTIHQEMLFILYGTFLKLSMFALLLGLMLLYFHSFAVCIPNG